MDIHNNIREEKLSVMQSYKYHMNPLKQVVAKINKSEVTFGQKKKYPAIVELNKYLSSN